MSSPTVIRHTITPEGFASVTTYFENGVLRSAVQVYRVGTLGRTVLEMSQIYTGEAGGIEHFNKLVEGIPD